MKQEFALRRHWQQAVLIAGSLLVSGGVFWYLQQFVSWAEVSRLIRQMPMLGIATFLMLSTIMTTFRCWRYLLLLRISGFHVRIAPLFLVTLVRNFFSDLLPARIGTLIFVYLARTRLGVSWSSASAGFAYSFIFDMISLGFLVLLAAMTATGIAQNPYIIIAAGIFFAAISTAVLFLLPTLLSWVMAGVRRFPFFSPELRSRFSTAVNALKVQLETLQKSGMYLPLLALSMGVRFFKYLGLYALLISLVVSAGYTAVDFPLSKVFFGFVAAEMAASLPISGLAGFGAYEGAWSLVFQLLGYSEKISALTSVSHHVLTQIYGYSIGALAFLLLLVPWKIMSPSSSLPNRAFNGFKFYTIAFLLFVVPLTGAHLAVSSLPADKTVNSASIEPQQQELPQGPPAGRLVYQRSDGIYVLDTTSKEEIRVTTSGTFPRWSPDGRYIAFLDHDSLQLMTADGKNQKSLAKTSGGVTLCFSRDGKSIFYTDADTVRKIDLASGTVSMVLSGHLVLEIDTSVDGRLLVATERIFGGYQVVSIHVPDGAIQVVSRGCSASISPGGRITVNGGNHRELFMFSSRTYARENALLMVDGKKFDNQFWSNHEDWLTSKSEGDEENIYIHHVPSGAAFQMTRSGGCDRANLFVVQK